MRLFIGFLASIGFGVAVHAGDTKLTCKNVDGSILITRAKLILLQKNSETKQYELTVLNNLSGNTTLSKDEIIEFGTDDNEGPKAGVLKVSKVSTSKQVAGNDGGTCKGGHGPGFSTEEYKTTGQLILGGQDSKSVELTCVESSFWGGTCSFDEVE